MNAVVRWLMDGDPAVRWQVMRDLLHAPEEEWRAERARTVTDGWCARLLDLQEADGTWASGACFPARVFPGCVCCGGRVAGPADE